MAEREQTNPYVGPRPFELGETGLFFGREREQRELLSLVVAHRVVLLYAASGAGKTSLLNAGLVPALEAEGFDVLPPARVRALSADEDVHAGSNVYVFGLLTHLSGANGEDVGGATIAEFLARREHPVGPDGYPAPRALIVDQLEELLTLHQDRWPEREGFFGQLAEAVRADPLLRVVLAIREDYLAQLDPYARRVPDRLRARIRLERLGAEAALEAATAPARRAGRSFAPGVAEKLVGDLLHARVSGTGGETVGVEGEYVEPVHLQVTCHSLWAGLPPGASEITEEHRLVFGDVDQVLSQFYEETVAAAAARASMSPDALRERFEQAFITPLDTRGTVYWTPEQTAGMPAAAVDEMDGRHLIRAELRAGARWYELTHDRLIGPVRASNRRRRAERTARRRRWQLRAAAAVVLLSLAALAAALVVLGASGEEEAAGSADVTRALERLIVEQARGISALALILRTQGGPLRQISFTPEGERLLTLASDGSIQIWNTFTGQRIRVLTPFRAGTQVASFDPRRAGPSPASRVLAARIGGSARVLSILGRTVARLPAGSGQVLAARFTLGGPLAITVDAQGRASFWAGGRRVFPLVGSRGVLAADISSDGRFVATDTGFRVDVWRLSTRKRTSGVRPPPPRLPGTLLSPFGLRLATPGSDGRVTVWSVVGGRRLRELPGNGEPVTALAFGPDSAKLASAGGRIVRVLDLPTGETMVLRGHTRTVRDVEISGDARLAVTASDDGTARVWSLVTGKSVAVLRGQASRVLTATFSPDGLLIVTGGEDGTARVWGSGPDLTLVRIRFDRPVPEARRILGRVENIGNTASRPTAVVAQAGDASARQAVPALQPGQGRAVTLPVPAGGSGGSVVVRVDPNGRNRELLENNNRAELPTVPTTQGGVSPVADRRRAIAAGALAGVRKAGQIHYTAGPLRMSGVRRGIQLPAVPPFEDTSSFVTWCYFQAGEPDPNGLRYNGQGYSGSLVTHGRPVPRPGLGDIVFYGSGPTAIRYVGIYVGGGRVVAHRSEQGPRLQALRPPSGPPFQFRTYVS